MRIQILGTAAAEGWPAIFCDCDTCRRARAAGGPNIRSRASVQIDDIFKIDMPPDTYYHTVRHGLELWKLKYLFFTHSHGDHFAADEVEYLRSGFSHNLANSPVQVFGNPTVVNILKARAERVANLPITIRAATPFEPIRADHLTFTPILAAHAPGEQALNYVIQSDTAAVLYASDTGLYERATMQYLSGCSFDLLIVECTQGTLDLPSKPHMGLSGVLELRQALTSAGATAPDTRCVITHFSHNMGKLHDEISAAANPEGIEVAYDGIVLEV